MYAPLEPFLKVMGGDDARILRWLNENGNLIICFAVTAIWTLYNNIFRTEFDFILIYFKDYDLIAIHSALFPENVESIWQHLILHNPFSFLTWLIRWSNYSNCLNFLRSCLTTILFVLLHVIYIKNILQLISLIIDIFMLKSLIWGM